MTHGLPPPAKKRRMGATHTKAHARIYKNGKKSQAGWGGYENYGQIKYFSAVRLQGTGTLYTLGLLGFVKNEIRGFCTQEKETNDKNCSVSYCVLLCRSKTLRIKRLEIGLSQV